MTDDEIIKALENSLTTKHIKLYLCDRDSNTSVVKATDILGLIKRQQEKISQLKDVIVAVKTERTWYQKLFETSRVEVIKEFAERLKQEGHIQLPPTGYPIDEDDWVVSKEDVEYIAAEMIGESYD